MVPIIAPLFISAAQLVQEAQAATQVPPPITDPNQVHIQNWPSLVYLLFVFFLPLILSNIAMWVRERQKWTLERAKNGQIKQIETSVNMINGKIGEVGVALGKSNTNIAIVKTRIEAVAKDLEGFGSHCRATTKSIGDQVEKNTQRIFDLAKSKSEGK